MDLKKLISVIFVIFPILDVYKLFSSITIGFAIIITAFVILVLINKKIIFDKNFILLTSILAIVHIISFIININNFANSTLFINNLLYIILYSLILSYFLKFKFDKIYFKLIYAIGIIATTIAFIQLISYYQFGEIPNFYFPIELKNRTIDAISPNRPSSIFLEPADYSIFLLPIFYLSIIQKKYILTLFFGFGLLISQSSTAIIGTIVIVLYSLTSLKNLSHILFVIFTIITLYVFFSPFITDLFYSSKTLEKFYNYNNESRLLGNIHILNEMKNLDLLIGLGIGQYQNFANFIGVKSFPFVNTFLYTIFNCGLVGIITLFVFLLKKLIKLKYKGIIIIFLMLTFSDNLFFSNWMIYLLIFSYIINTVPFIDNNTH